MAKALKAIQKSKKASDVQALMKDNEALQLKLQNQEEDFRLQNQTLVQELSKVRIVVLCLFLIMLVG